MSTLLDLFSNRSKMIVFLTRKDAGRRGAKALEVNDLLDAVIREDQGELATRLSSSVTTSGPIRPPHPFFMAGAAAKVLSKLEQVLQQGEAIPDATDLPVSPELEVVLMRAAALAKELHHSSVEPLHLVAAMLSEENSWTAEILKDAGVSREAVIAAL